MSPSQRKLALALYDIGCFQDKKQSQASRGFLLKLHEENPDAPRSPFYLNLRTKDNPKPGPLTPELVAAIGRELWNLARDQRVHSADRVAGVPNAGDPLAAALSEVSGLPLLHLGKKEHADGRRVSTVEGDVIEEQDVLLVDDLITTAASKLEAITVLEQRGLGIRAVLVLVDREQGGADELLDHSVPFHALFTLTELLDLYVAEGRISREERKEITAYIRENS